MHFLVHISYKIRKWGNLSMINQNKINPPTHFNISTPLSISIDITNMCNLKCLHCYNSSGNKRENELSEDELKSVVRQIADMKTSYVCLCGGETLCCPHVFDLIKMLKGNTGSINMVSNGFLITEETVIKLIDSGLDMLQISIDGLTDIEHDTFRGRRGSFEKAINAVELCVKHGLTTSVSCCPNKLNYNSISELIDYCYQLGVVSFRMMPLIPMGRGSAIENLLLSEEEYFKLKQLVNEKKNKYFRTNYQIEWGDPLDHLKRMPANSQIGYSTYMMIIKSNGDITMTPYLPIVVGNVRKHTLKEYWDAGFKDIWKNENIIKYISTIETITDLGNGGDQALTTNGQLRIELL